MFQIFNAAIDAVQNAKTQTVKTFVTDENLAKPMYTYIDAQASFAKKLTQESLNFYTTVGNALMNFDAKKAFSVK
jgi:hypothetical protein